MNDRELIPHLFRAEYSKITAVLCKFFGLENMEISEDIASETFLAALETWPYKGIPANPTAWLYSVAKNKARNYLVRNHTFAAKIATQLKQLSPDRQGMEIDLSDTNISDSQLQMLFAICHPAISKEAQIGLALRILCGFGIDEIANAFLTQKETINKRLFRAREKIREEGIRIEFPAASEINDRLETVLTTLYLLFNEGYYSESRDPVLREDLCIEAMRLTSMLVENDQTNLPAVNALLALMCFHASRFKARMNKEGMVVLYDDQDESLWDQDLIARGATFLHKASQGDGISKYHLEAGIAYMHTGKAQTKEKWDAILQLYNKLLVIEYSPIAALNRTYALSKVKGKEEAIVEAERLNIADNHFYFILLGELYKGIDNARSLHNFQRALLIAKTNADKEIIRRKIEDLRLRATQ